MKRLTQLFPVFLAAVLQIMPLVRNLFINPAVGNSFAFILRWGIGSAVGVGAYDACSGASGTYMNTSSNIIGTVGVAMNFTNNFVINGGNTATTDDYIYLQSWDGLASTANLTNGMSTTFLMPVGLTIKCYSINNAANIYSVITGTPSSPTSTNLYISAVYAKGGFVFTTNIHFNISAAISTPPTITNQPASLTNLVGSNVTFSVTAGGTAPLSYQWYFNTNTPVGAATNVLTLNSIQLTNGGYYRCTITNSAGSVTSSNALLTVWQKPNITNPPAASTTLMAGGSATLSVGAIGVPANTYQWRLAGGNLAGANSATLPLTLVRTNQAGSYTVVITNSAGSVTSAIASLVVTNPLPSAFAPTAPAMSGGKFQLTFTPVIGLTNTVLTNGVLVGGTWNVFTNIPPPINNTQITLSNLIGATNLFFRVMVMP